jgi:aromatic ring-opening dioxygenase LigB subunit
MTLVYACIAPHGGELVPRLAGQKLRLFAPTRKGIRMLADRMARARPDTVVVASPHNLRLHEHLGVVLSEYSSGRVEEGGRAISLSARCDVRLAWEILREAERVGLPVVGVNYGTFEGPASNLAMDWGTLIPLWFFLKERRIKSRIVVVTPSSKIPLLWNLGVGRAIVGVFERRRKIIAFVASSDQAHAHRRDAPYGFSLKADAYDRMVIDAVSSGKLKTLTRLKRSFVDAAKPDSLWQMTILAGMLEEVPMEGAVLSYQVPTYFGMLCADYSRT